MTLGILLAFVGLHLILGVASWLGGWVMTDTDVGLDAVVDATPLGQLVGEDSTFARGLNDVNLLSPIALAIDSFQFFLALVSFEYELFSGDGVAGMVGTLLNVIGHCIAAWVFFQIARAVAGSLGFGR